MVLIIVAVIFLAGGGYFAHQRFARTVPSCEDIDIAPEEIDRVVVQAYSTGRFTGDWSDPEQWKVFLEYLEQELGCTLEKLPYNGAIDTSTWKIYRNEQYGFEVRYPSEWEEDEFSLPGHFEITKKGSRRDVTLTVRTPLSAAGSAFINTNFDKNISISNGIPARYKKTVTKLDDNTTLSTIVVQYTYLEGGVIIFKYVGSEDIYSSLFDQIISTFKFIR